MTVLHRYTIFIGILLFGLYAGMPRAVAGILSKDKPTQVEETKTNEILPEEIPKESTPATRIPEPQAPKAPKPKPIDPNSPEAEAQRLIQDKPKKPLPNYFARINLQSINKLAWALGAYDPMDMEAIDRYMLINECHLYHKFFQNDFEWDKVRRATSSYLKEYRQNVPRFYEFVQPVRLQRYDFKLQGFVLEDVEKFISLRQFQLLYHGRTMNECNDELKESQKTPNAAVLIVKTPFSLPFMRVPDKIAQEYINVLVKNNVNIEKDGRPAYLRFRLSVSNYGGIITNNNQESYYQFTGRLRSVELFADKELTLPMYSQYF